MAVGRKFGDKVYKWNVPDLLEQAVGLPVEEVSVSRFNLDVDAWFGEAGPPTITAIVHHMLRVEEADLSEPIVLSVEGHVLDGLHRLAKCMLRGIPTIPARQFKVNPPPCEIVDFRAYQRQRPMIAATLEWMETHGL